MKKHLELLIEQKNYSKEIDITKKNYYLKIIKNYGATLIV